jgi:hypothetical protein
MGVRRAAHTFQSYRTAMKILDKRSENKIRIAFSWYTEA